jgi:ribose-phosphate pyrophosphokinase
VSSRSVEGLMLGFPECDEQARDIASAARLDFAPIEVHHFPDGESRIRLPQNLPARVFIHRSLDQPNQKLIELVLAASTARELGAKQLTLVAPYLCYMRQDKAFQPGEAVSQRAVGALLADHFDELVTVDPHLHRVSSLQEAVPVHRALSLAATDAMSLYLAGRIDNPLLLGPDGESEQWVGAIAEHGNLDFCVAAKRRLGDNHVQVSLPDTDYEGRQVVLVDDVISTGHTLAEACAALVTRRPAGITVMATHALFVNDAEQRIRAAGAQRIWTCDSVKHPTNRISLTDCIAGGLRKLNTC